MRKNIGSRGCGELLLLGIFWRGGHDEFGAVHLFYVFRLLGRVLRGEILFSFHPRLPMPVYVFPLPLLLVVVVAFCTPVGG